MVNSGDEVQMRYVTFIILLIFTAGCASTPPPVEPSYTAKRGTQKPYRIDGKWYTPMESAYGYEEEGIASWYGRDFHGRKTSNGETYNMHAMTAAHKTLPMGTYVKVTRLDSGKETVVRIIDRGPFVSGRIIDLSYKAAQSIGMAEEGTAGVSLVALGSRKGNKLVKQDYDRGDFSIQVGAFTVRANAERLKDRLDSRFDGTYMTTFNKDGRLFYRVRIGNIKRLTEARAVLERLAGEGFGAAFVVAD